MLSANEIVNNKQSEFPIISKPNWGGSSQGIEFINDKNKFKKRKNNNQNLIEEIIIGKELTVTVIEFNNKINALGVTEIEFNNLHYDYIAKYTKNKSLHFLPARISKKQYNFLMNLSKKIFIICKCRAIARLDYIVSNKNGRIYLLEINTHPGLTKISLAPEQANYQGISYFNLLQQIINKSL